MIGADTATWPRPSLNSGTRHIVGLQSLEAELAAGLLDAWRELMLFDPKASLFQSPGWCVPWYRCYNDQYEPFLIVVAEVGTLLGLVPMAVRRDTRALVFASETMADYRDIVALPGSRGRVVHELVQAYVRRRFSGVLEVGWLDPTSDTPELLSIVARGLGLRTTTRHQPCWRWFPPPPSRPSAQKFLNWYKRHGAVTFDLIRSIADWDSFKQTYYQQHSLRQIQAARSTSFDDSRRSAFYDALFRSEDIACHVTAFRVNGEMLAGHFGYVWRNVLLLGPPSIRLEDEPRSPAVILLSWIIQNAAALGLAGFDLTIGESDFKARLGNQCVQLTTVEVHGTQRTYMAHVARTSTVSIAKRVVAALAGEDAWKNRIKPLVDRVNDARRIFAETSAAASIVRATSRALSAVAQWRVSSVYSTGRPRFQPLDEIKYPTSGIVVHDNCVDDLLLSRHESFETRSAITSCARAYARDRAMKRSLHTLLIEGKLAAWVYSEMLDSPFVLDDSTGAVFAIDAPSVVLSGLHRLPGFVASPVYEALISCVVSPRLAVYDSKAVVVVEGSNKSLQAAIKQLGFELFATRSSRRFLGRTASTITRPKPRA